MAPTLFELPKPHRKRTASRALHLRRAAPPKASLGQQNSGQPRASTGPPATPLPAPAAGLQVRVGTRWESRQDCRSFSMAWHDPSRVCVPPSRSIKDGSSVQTSQMVTPDCRTGQDQKSHLPFVLMIQRNCILLRSYACWIILGGWGMARSPCLPRTHPTKYGAPETPSVGAYCM